jgi:transposase
METISMSGRERKRLVVMTQVRAGKVRLRAAADLLDVSYRQMKRLWSRYQAEGDRGLVHGLRGKRSNRRSESSLREQVLARYAESFADYGPTLAAESLAEEGIEVSVTTLRRWLSQAELWQRKRVRKQHRRRRARKEFLGELVQMDGSHHNWFEGRREWAVLMVMIDDATGRIFARFFEEETLEAAFEMLQRYTALHGLPLGLYVDRAGIYRADREPTEAEILAGKEPQTQFGRAMKQLDVRLILARSPQAKGRVERMNGTLQDRLVKALRQRGISDLASANEFLEREFLAPFNAKFGKPAAQPADMHRAVAKEVDLARVLAVHEERVVQNDWTLRWQNGFLQLGRASGVQPKDRVEVCVQLDGRVRLFARDRELSYGTTRSEPRPASPSRSPSGVPKSNQGQKPSAKHPWRGKGRELVPS